MLREGGAEHSEATKPLTLTKPSLLSEYARKTDLAREFGVSERTIERWVRLRLLPTPIRLGRTSLYHLPAVRKRLLNQVERTNKRRSGRRT